MYQEQVSFKTLLLYFVFIFMRINLLNKIIHIV